MLSHIASHGIAVVTMNRLSMAAPSEKVPYFEDTMNWAETNLQDKLHSEGIPDDVLLDFTTLIGNQSFFIICGSNDWLNL